MGEEHDLKPLLNVIQWVCDTWTVDQQKILLTGMSDGGTYSLMAASQQDSPFTHVAPFSGVLHPDLVMTGDIRHLTGRPVYLVHGTDDWMFPVETAQMASHQLEAHGVDLTTRIVDGLAHTFARNEIPDLLTWFNSER